MPIATTLPQNNVTLRYPPARVDEAGQDVLEEYQLLELPPEILKVVEASGRDEPFPLTIKGTPADDAVLCTPSSTFLLRQITVSNSLLICRTPPGSRSAGGDGDSQAPTPLEIRGTNHHILECVPQAADLERIRRLLRDSQWEGMVGTGDEGDGARASKRRKRADGSVDVGPGHGKGHAHAKKWTKAQLGSVVQASQDELERGLRERNVVEVDGYMLMLAPPKLRPLAQLILTLLTIHMTSSNLSSTPPTVTSPTAPILSTLEDDHEVPRAVVQGVIDLFGVVDSEWRCEVARLVAQIGLGILQATTPAAGRPVDVFLSDWRAEVGEMWEALVDVKLLEGNYLLNDPPLSTLINPAQTITYFPLHALPLHAPTRFADLFLTRQRWRPEEMTPFLRGLTRDGDKKEQDKLIVKFVRVVKDKEGVWWHPRRTG